MTVNAAERMSTVIGLPREPQERDLWGEDARESLLARMVPGAAFVLDIPDVTPALWGSGTSVLWAEGEALMVAGGSGVGKTTLAGQLVRGRLGLSPELLGSPMVPGKRRVLYLAMDRPAQTARALHRVFTEDERPVLDARLVVWKGPPPLDLAKHPSVLAEMCAGPSGLPWLD